MGISILQATHNSREILVVVKDETKNFSSQVKIVESRIAYKQDESSGGVGVLFIQVHDKPCDSWNLNKSNRSTFDACFSSHIKRAWRP